MLNLLRRRRPADAIALAMVALNRPQLPAPEVLQEYLSQHSGLAAAVEPADAGEGAVAGLTVDLGDDVCMVPLVPFPIPWQDLEGPCRTAWWWPEATEVMRAHQAHAIVTLFPRGDDVLDNYLLLTRLVAAVAATADAAGVYWGAGTIVHPLETPEDCRKHRSSPVVSDVAARHYLSRRTSCGNITQTCTPAWPIFLPGSSEGWS